ncbi:MAG: hypothetical protein K2W96_04125 [Gemmataceae bacterium]|nr:hypothetical protein [Gemmataceae bacterium]
MATCRVCNTKLFGDEILAGTCENCVGKSAYRRPETEDYHRRSSSPPDEASFSVVKLGVRLLFVGSLINLFALIAHVVALFNPQARIVFLGINYLATAILIPGSLICCVVPHHAKMGGLATMAGVLLVLSWIGYGILQAMFNLSIRPPSEPFLMTLILMLVPIGLAAYLALVALLSGLARVRQQPSLADRIILLPVVSLALCGLVFGPMPALIAGFRDPYQAQRLILFVGYGLAFVISVYTLVLLNELADALTR